MYITWIYKTVKYIFGVKLWFYYKIKKETICTIISSIKYCLHANCLLLVKVTIYLISHWNISFIQDWNMQIHREEYPPRFHYKPDNQACISSLANSDLSPQPAVRDHLYSELSGPYWLWCTFSLLFIREAYYSRTSFNKAVLAIL